MESFLEQRLNALQADPKPGCGRAGCTCGLPVSERLSADVIALPMHAYLDEPTQDRIIGAVRGALR